jgi:hypothetical protein
MSQWGTFLLPWENRRRFQITTPRKNEIKMPLHIINAAMIFLALRSRPKAGLKLFVPNNNLK